MHHPRQVAPSGLSRRAVLGSAGALGLALATHRLRGAAQDATPAATPFPRRGHPVIGAWQLDHDPANLEAWWGTKLTIVTFSPDGTYLEYDGFFGIGIGLWRATGERTAELVIAYQRLAGAQDLTTLEAVFAPDYVSPGHAFERDVATMRLSIAVAAPETTMTLAGTFTARPTTGSYDYSDDDYRAIATRLAPIATGAATPTA